jgi:N-acetyl-alpha-D-glucosaminyl L-malate synthase BshA
VTAVSGFLRQRTMEWLDDVPDKIRVIPNFVDTDVFRPAKRRAEALVVHVSNFRPVKRSADALRAFYLVRKKRPAKMLFIGDGPEAAAVKTLAKKLRVADDVEFRGEDRDVQAVIAKSRVLVSTSEFEGFGLAPLEAMSCGVPVVATDSGGVREVVSDDCGFVVPVGSVEALAEKMRAVLDDGALARRMGEAGRARAEKHFRPSVVVPRYEETYEEPSSEAAHA